jgi:DNA-binding transcriptional regulator GbsR (MarR family)
MSEKTGKAVGIEQKFIDRTGKIAKLWGLGEPTGRVLGVLMFSEKPLSQREIADKTGYTLSLVSPNLKIIDSLDMLGRSRGSGKEKVYHITVSFIDAFDRMIKRFLQQDILPLIQELDDAKGKNPHKKKIIEQMSRDYKKVELYLAVFEKMMMLDKIRSDKIRKLLARQ